MDAADFRTRPEDAIESEMGGDDVVHREKGLARGTMGVALGYGTLVAATSSASVIAGAPLWTLAVPALLSAGVALFALTKTVIRTVVTRQEVIVRSGMREHRVPLSAITSTEVREAGALSPRGVQLRYTEDGKTRAFWMAARNPAVLIAAIEHARSAGPRPARVRVDDAVDEDTADEVEQEVASSARSRTR